MCLEEPLGYSNPPANPLRCWRTCRFEGLIVVRLTVEQNEYDGQEHGKEIRARRPGKCSACMLGIASKSWIKVHYTQGWVHKRCWHDMVDRGMSPRAIRDRITRERLEAKQQERDRRKLGHVDPATGLPAGVVPPAPKRQPSPIDEMF